MILVRPGAASGVGGRWLGCRLLGSPGLRGGVRQVLGHP